MSVTLPATGKLHQRGTKEATNLAARTLTGTILGKGKGAEVNQVGDAARLAPCVALFEPEPI